MYIIPYKPCLRRVRRNLHIAGEIFNGETKIHKNLLLDTDKLTFYCAVGLCVDRFYIVIVIVPGHSVLYILQRLAEKKKEKNLLQKTWHNICSLNELKQIWMGKHYPVIHPFQFNTTLPIYHFSFTLMTSWNSCEENKPSSWWWILLWPPKQNHNLYLPSPIQAKKKKMSF